MVRLRSYQEDLLQEAERTLEAPHARVMLQLPTGGGKTRIAASLLAGWVRDGGKAAWLTHRRELSDQTRNELDRSGVHATNTLEWEFYDLAPSIGDGVAVLMAQTVSRRNKRFEGLWDKYRPEDLLIIDEAHHATAPGWERAIHQWPGRVIGLTATPRRLEKNLGFNHLFDHLILGPQISELQAKGYLAHAQVLRPDDDDLIFAGIPPHNGDYREEEIERLNRTRRVWTGGTLEYWQKHAEGRQTIIYAVSVGHANNLAEVFNNAGVSAGVILGANHQKEQERQRNIRQFRKEELKVLVNVAVATEGFDLPEVSCIVLARPTMSLALYLQMVGRGLRRKDDGADYTDCLILDLAGNDKRHGFPDDERKWSLEPLGWRGEGNPSPKVRCPECERVSHAASHNCQYCGSPFGKTCQRCSKWQGWKDWSAEAYCGDDHELVCDRCHPDAHIVPNLSEGLKKMLRKEPVDGETKLTLSDLHTVDATRDLLCEVMENLIYAKKVDDTGTFTRILEKQLKPLLRKEGQLRKAQLEQMTAELETALTPSLLDFVTEIRELYEGRRKVTAFQLDFEKGTRYQWEENGEVHWEDWSSWSQDEQGLLDQRGAEY